MSSLTVRRKLFEICEKYNDMIWVKGKRVNKNLTKEMLEPFKQYGLREGEIERLVALARKKTAVERRLGGDSLLTEPDV